jgi:hypothetical protein
MRKPAEERAKAIRTMKAGILLLGIFDIVVMDVVGIEGHWVFFIGHEMYS